MTSAGLQCEDCFLYGKPDDPVTYHQDQQAYLHESCREARDEDEEEEIDDNDELDFND